MIRPAEQPTADHPAEDGFAPRSGPSRWMPMLVIAVLMMSFITGLTRLYGDNAALPRYCENPDQTLYYLEKVLSEKEPAGDEARRPYLIAAKLVYLLPQQSGESLPDYLQRVREHILQQCP